MPQCSPKDALFGASYNRARYYDQVGGRFISEDPIGFRAGPNFYIYANNNPTTLADPFGLQKEDPNWFLRWGNRFFNWLTNPLIPRKPGDPQPAPVNVCEAGDTRLFFEAGPNPFTENRKYYPEWVEFTRQFVRKCEAAQKPGKYTYTKCPAGSNIGGVYAFCSCCEGCEKKK